MTESLHKDLTIGSTMEHHASNTVQLRWNGLLVERAHFMIIAVFMLIGMSVNPTSTDGSSGYNQIATPLPQPANAHPTAIVGVHELSMDSKLATPIPTAAARAASKEPVTLGGKAASHEPVAPDQSTTAPSCAIVFNSGTLVKNEHGAEIDDHDWVVRFNMGCTETFEKFVGSRTTHHFIWGGLFEAMENDYHVEGVKTYVFPQYSGKLANWKRNRKPTAAGKDIMSSTIPGEAECKRFFKTGRTCSTGANAIYWAVK